MAGFAPFGVLSPGEEAEQGPSLLDKLVSGIISGTVQIPKHVIDAATSTAPPGLRREDYTDIPPPQGTAPFGLSPQAWQPGDPLRAASMDTAANLAGVGTSFAVPGAAGIFGGRLAATADKAALVEAERMATAGVDRQEIWDKTGWFKGGDNKWRFEIPDDKARINPNVYGEGEMKQGHFGPLAGHLWHKELYEAYPDARRATGYFEPSARESGSYQAAEHSPTGEETVKVAAPTVPRARSVALHEAQHLVQEREGFATGGSPAYFTQADEAKDAASALAYRREIARLDPSLTPKQKDDIIRKQYEDLGAPDWFPNKEARALAHHPEDNPQRTLERIVGLYGLDQRVTPYSARELYREIPGEVEARNVQMRSLMTPAERRATPPWQTQDATPRPIMNELFGQRVGLLER